MMAWLSGFLHDGLVNDGKGSVEEFIYQKMKTGTLVDVQIVKKYLCGLLNRI